MKTMIPISLCLLLLTACAGSRKIATVGDTEFIAVKSPSLLGPSINMIVSKKTNDISPTLHDQFGGNGVLGSVVNAAGLVGAAAVYGKSLEANQVNVNTIRDNPNFIGPLQPPQPTTIGNEKNDHPFTKGKQ